MRRTLLAVMVGVAFLSGPTTAAAAPADLTIDDTTPAIGEDRTVDIGLTNLTDDDLAVTITPAADCALTPRSVSLPVAEHTSVTVTVPVACGPSFTVAAGTEITVRPEPATTTPSQWLFLLVFPGLLLVFGGVACLWLARLRKKRSSTTLHLDATWSFTESWAGNVTVLGGLLTGVLGSSEIVTALLGADADDAIALAIVGAAIAAAFTAAGPILLQATKNGKRFTAAGLLFAAAVTLAAAMGELVVVTVTALRMDFGGWPWTTGVLLGGVAAVGLLVVYVYRTLSDLVVVKVTAEGGAADDGPPRRSASL